MRAHRRRTWRVIGASVEAENLANQSEYDRPSKARKENAQSRDPTAFCFYTQKGSAHALKTASAASAVGTHCTRIALKLSPY